MSAVEIKLERRQTSAGIVKLEILNHVETEDFIVCMLHEERMKDKRSSQCWLNPVIVFKKKVNQGDYDVAIRSLKKAGIDLLFPDKQEFRGNYLDVSFFGHKIMLRCFGYSSELVSKTRQWTREKKQAKAYAWMDDTVWKAMFITFTMKMVSEGIPEEERVELLKGLFDLELDEWVESNPNNVEDALPEGVVCD